VSAFEHLDRIDPSTVAHLDPDLRVLDGRVRLPAALRSHSLVYERRPDVHAVIHLHSHHVAVLSATAGIVGMYHVAAVRFAGEQVLHVDDGSRPHTAVVDTLGDARVAIMKNHGALLVSESLEDAVVDAITLESCARIHLDAQLHGASEIAPAEVEAGRQNFVPHHLEHTWQAWLARVLAGWPELDGLSGRVDPAPTGGAT
jgi:L-fuculose-phosphate aldolase